MNGHVVRTAPSHTKRFGSEQLTRLHWESVIRPTWVSKYFAVDGSGCYGEKANSMGVYGRLRVVICIVGFFYTFASLGKALREETVCAGHK